MHLLAILFFAAAGFAAWRVIGDVMDEDGARMWEALMGRSVQPVMTQSARVIVLRQPEQPRAEALSPEVLALPLAA